VNRSLRNAQLRLSDNDDKGNMFKVLLASQQISPSLPPRNL